MTSRPSELHPFPARTRGGAGCDDHSMTDITGIVNLVLFVCLVVYLTRLRATLTRSAEAQERIARALERQAGE